MLQFAEVLLKVVYVFEDFFQDVIQTLGALMLQSCALRPQQLGVLLIVVQAPDAFFDVELLRVKVKAGLTSIC